MPEVISDTSPIQYLYQIGYLDVLNVLYGQIIIPEAVAGELNIGRAQGLNLPDVSSINWITLKRPQGQALLSLVPVLGSGEREAIALAGETKDPLLILDDALARKHAQLLGIKMTGTLGVLLKAKQTGQINAIKPALNHLETLGLSFLCRSCWSISSPISSPNKEGDNVKKEGRLYH